MSDKLFGNEYQGIDGEFLNCIYELMDSGKVVVMKGMKKHADVDCFDHCLFVSYVSFLTCKRLGMDCRSAARGGLLHDFYLYDKSSVSGFKHRAQHPKIALENADLCFELSDKEKDIILKHMWPITFGIPRYRESFVVDAVDKYCTYLEITGSNSLKVIDEIKRLLTY